MDSQGWIKLFRKFKDWEWYQDANVSRIFIHLLLSVNFEDKKWQGVDIKRGDIVIGIENFGSQIGLTRQQTRSALDKLKSTNEITIKTTNKFTVITINKFNEYQEITSKVTNEQPTNNQQITTTKEYKNEKNENNSILNNIHTSYKNKILKDSKLTLKAKDKIKARLKEYSEEQLLKAIDNFSSDKWWTENNSGRGMAWFFNSDDRIEQFLNIKSKPENKPKDFNSLMKM